MKLKNVESIADFRDAVASCKHDVWLESPSGDKFNLKSPFSQYVAIGALIQSEGDKLELYCADHRDEQYFYELFQKHPEIL